MEFVSFTSDPPRSPYAPTYDYTLGFSCNDNINFKKLSQLCLDKEKILLKIPPEFDKNGKCIDGYTGLGESSTTARWFAYNVLSWNTSETKNLKNYIKSQILEYNEHLNYRVPSILYIQCWINILRYGEEIKPHLHNVDSDCYLSANFTVKGNDTSTFYLNPINQIQDPQIMINENKPGNFTIFPSNIPHYTNVYQGNEERISIGIDIMPYKKDNRPLLEMNMVI